MTVDSQDVVCWNARRGVVVLELNILSGSAPECCSDSMGQMLILLICSSVSSLYWSVDATDTVT